ncbi:MAG: hypothetical protein OXG65_10685 [Chloroflexi bacterium]|nr:hypothetical protein [Chloroflexota bacterium]
MTFFFDRCVGVQIPRALHAFKRFPVEIRYRQGVFGPDRATLPDDQWMMPVARDGWIVVTQDYCFLRVAATQEAVRQHKAAVFYLWGANALAWQTTRMFLWALPRMIERLHDTDPPYVYRVEGSSRVRAVSL